MASPPNFISWYFMQHNFAKAAFHVCLCPCRLDQTSQYQMIYPAQHLQNINRDLVFYLYSSSQGRVFSISGIRRNSYFLYLTIRTTNILQNKKILLYSNVVDLHVTFDVNGYFVTANYLHVIPDICIFAALQYQLLYPLNTTYFF